MNTDTPVEHLPHRRAAREAVAEAVKGRHILIHYAQTVQQVQLLLQRHGLGQALAGLHLRAGGRPGSPYGLLIRQLDRWILTTQAVSARSALAALASHDSRFYREATAQAWLFVRALREILEQETPAP